MEGERVTTETEENNEQKPQNEKLLRLMTGYLQHASPMK